MDIEIVDAYRIEAFGELSNFYYVTYSDESTKNVPMNLDNVDYVILLAWLESHNKI